MTPAPAKSTGSKTRNKSVNAIIAENNGERTWTGWRKRELIAQVIQASKNELTEDDFTGLVLEHLKVRVLRRTEEHHTAVALDAAKGVQGGLVWYYKVDDRKVARLTPVKLDTWKRELDECADPRAEINDMVKNLTDKVYYWRGSGTYRRV